MSEPTENFYAFVPPAVHPLVITGENNRHLLTLKADGTVVADLKDVDEAARVFIKCLESQWGVKPPATPTGREATGGTRALALEIYRQVAPLLEEQSEPNPEDYVAAILAALQDSGQGEGGDMVTVPREDWDRFVAQTEMVRAAAVVDGHDISLRVFAGMVDRLKAAAKTTQGGEG